MEGDCSSTQDTICRKVEAVATSELSPVLTTTDVPQPTESSIGKQSNKGITGGYFLHFGPICMYNKSVKYYFKFDNTNSGKRL